LRFLFSQELFIKENSDTARGIGCCWWQVLPDFRKLYSQISR